MLKDAEPLSPELYTKPTYIREWRKYKKMTQQEVAERLDMEQGTISKIENRTYPINLDFLEKLAFVLGIEVADLLSVNPLKPNPPKLIYSKVRTADPELQLQVMKVVDALLKDAS